MRFLRPRSLMGQMLLAVAAALLLVQGLGAFLIYREQSQRLESALLHGAAFRLGMATQGRQDASPRRFRDRPFGRRSRGFRIERTAQSPLRPGEERDAASETKLRYILAEDAMHPADVVVTYRRISDDPYASERISQRQREWKTHKQSHHRRLLIAAIRIRPDGEWMIARVYAPAWQRDVIAPLLLQTAIIYLVLMVAVALILRQITRPLAALTGRVERFAATQDREDQIEPVGPDDIRRLIIAHNAMESRISALLDEKDVMLGAIGHDLKTPLAALRVRIEAVEDDTERAKMAATIEDIVRSLDDILSLARVGRPSDARERNELSALVASVVEEYEDMGEPVELCETERIVLAVRPTWLRRALRNLIGNALRYGKRARVSLEQRDGMAAIRIEDDGPGIAEDRMASMMDPFTRGEPSRNTETGGAGLGLALARAIAEQHGGALHLSNRYGPTGHIIGLAVTLELPST